MARKRKFNVFSLSFLDIMSCGFGAVVLFFMIINHGTVARSQEINKELLAEVDLLEQEVLQGEERMVLARNTIEEIDLEVVTTEGLSRQLIKDLQALREELAEYEADSLASKEDVNALKSDLQALEEASRRLEGAVASEGERGDATRSFIGEGNRQYLTGLRMGGERVLILLDASASMLDETIVNVIRRRNLPDNLKRESAKWQRALRTVDWLSTQIPQASKFQIYTFNTSSRPAVKGTEGRWLDAGDGTSLEEAVVSLKQVVPSQGTRLHSAWDAVRSLQPLPDNIYIIVDGLPTMGENIARGGKVSGRDRVRHMDRSLRSLPSGIPVNIIMFPMEGDPMAAPSYWQLAQATGGSFMSPSEDWP
ncbi:MAG: VWA domain-containing protein [Gammaproteobacteria bacterium]|nr:VWA domain-containing protein [Gammaproteobacteria bacterium]